jgi:hypothetical protein
MRNLQRKFALSSSRARSPNPATRDALGFVETTITFRCCTRDSHLKIFFKFLVGSKGRVTQQHSISLPHAPCCVSHARNMTRRYLLRPLDESLVSSMIVQLGESKVIGRGEQLNISNMAVSRTQCVVTAGDLGLILTVQKKAVYVVLGGSLGPARKVESGAQVQVSNTCSTPYARGVLRQLASNTSCWRFFYLVAGAGALCSCSTGICSICWKRLGAYSSALKSFSATLPALAPACRKPSLSRRRQQPWALCSNAATAHPAQPLLSYPRRRYGMWRQQQGRRRQQQQQQQQQRQQPRSQLAIHPLRLTVWSLLALASLETISRC